jgi:hypothetical protein
VEAKHLRPQSKGIRDGGPVVVTSGWQLYGAYRSWSDQYQEAVSSDECKTMSRLKTTQM